MTTVAEALALLTPYDISKPKVRIGPKADGGYVLVDDIHPSQSVLSYGISTQYQFDRDMAEAGHDVYMFDHTIPGIKDAHEKMHFFKEGVAGVSRPEDNLYTIQDHLNRHKIVGNRMILKMDVEGWEFGALSALPDDTLARFEQISVEVHFLTRLNKPEFRRRFVKLFRKLNSIFTLHHVHANNWKGVVPLQFVSGLIVPPLLELSYVRTDTVERFPSRTLYPTSLDYPNVAKHRDISLWFYPFLPTPVTSGEFAACSDRLDLLDEIRTLRQAVQPIAVANSVPELDGQRENR